MVIRKYGYITGQTKEGDIVSVPEIPTQGLDLSFHLQPPFAEKLKIGSYPGIATYLLATEPVLFPLSGVFLHVFKKFSFRLP